MGDRQPMFQPGMEEKRSRMPALAGVGVVLVLIGILLLLSRGNQNSTTESAGLAPPDLYAAELSISNLKMSTADNFAGASVTYLDGQIENRGAHTFKSITMQVAFKDQVGQLIQKETLPLVLIVAHEPYVDTGALSASPLKPGEIREFRLAFEHISDLWNRNYPELRIIRTVSQ
jgi:hypothetical protein